MSVICITGVTSGIGKATAELFLRNGWKVIGSGRRKDRLAELQSAWGKSFLPLTFDVGNREEVEAAFASLPKEFAAIDVMLNNAGISLAGPGIQDARLDDLEVMVQTNIMGVLYCCKAVLPGMIQRGHGYVITLGSYSATWPNPGTNVYSASKAFVQLLTYDIREDLVGTPIRTTCIVPSVTQTEFPLARMKGDAQAAAKRFENLDPIQPEDIAQTILYCVNTPERININEIRITPTRQTYGAARMNREPYA